MLSDLIFNLLLSILKKKLILIIKLTETVKGFLNHKNVIKKIKLTEDKTLKSNEIKSNHNKKIKKNPKQL